MTYNFQVNLVHAVSQVQPVSLENKEEKVKLVNADQEVMKVQKVHLVHPVSKDHPVLTAKRVLAVKRVTKVS